MLTITATSGLCNRLFALHSGAYLARDIGQPLRVIWKRNKALGARFEDLFKVPSAFAEIVTFERRHFKLARRLQDEVVRYTRWPPLKRAPREHEIIDMCEQGFDFRTLGQKRNSALRAFGLFYAHERPFFPFQPVAQLQKRIEDAVPEMGRLVGVHIRRTDHLSARLYSPTRLFIDEMRRLSAADASLRFLLCTDSPEEEAVLSETFPSRIVTLDKRSLDRSQDVAIEDAVVDLFALSRCSRIIGSLASTFSQAAGLIGGIEVDYLTTEPDPHLYWREEDLPVGTTPPD